MPQGGLTQNQLDPFFETAVGRGATPYEVNQYSGASPVALGNLKNTYSKYNTTQSITDYLKYSGIDPATAPELGKQYGINNIGTAEGNIALLKAMKAGPPKPPASVTGTITPTVTEPTTATNPTGDITTQGGAVLNPDGSIKTPAQGAQIDSSTGTSVDQPPAIPGITDAKTAYTTAQQSVVDVTKQIADITNTINSALEEKKKEIAASGGVVDEAQLKSIVLTENAPLIQERDKLNAQRSQLVGEQGIAGKAYQDMVNQQKESDANFFKGQTEQDKQTTLNQGQQKIDETAAQNDIKNTQADEKLAQAGFKLTKVNITDGAGNVLGQQLIWSKNPANASDAATIASDNASATKKTSSGNGGITKTKVTNTGNMETHPPLTITDGATPEQVLKTLISGKALAIKGSPGVPLTQQDLYNLGIADMLGSTSAAGGRTPTGAILAVKDKETQIMNAYGLTPFDVASAKEQFKGMGAANAELLATAAFTKTYASTANDNLQLALNQSDKVPRGGAKMVNNYKQWVAGNFTPAGDLAAFETYIYTASREYAKVTSGGAKSSAGLTDSAQAEAAKLINAAQSPEVFKKVVTAMQADMNNVINNFDKQTGSFPDAVKKLYGMAGTAGDKSNNDPLGLGL